MITEITTVTNLIEIDMTNWPEQIDQIEADLESKLYPLGYLVYRAITYELNYKENTIKCVWSIIPRFY